MPKGYPFPSLSYFSDAQCQSGISCSEHLLKRWRWRELPGVSQKLTVLLDLLKPMANTSYLTGK